MALINCPECGKEVSERAITCPNCGMKIGNGYSNKQIRITITVLLIIAACSAIAAYYITLHPEVINGTSENVTSVKTYESSPQNQIEQENHQPVFGVCDTAEYNGIQVTLLGVTESEGNDYIKPEAGNIFVYPEFEFVNNSDSELMISSLVTFEAYQDDYSTSVSFEAGVVKSGESLDATIAPGKKLKGAIGFELPKEYSKLEIDVSLGVWSDEKIVFIYNK